MIYSIMFLDTFIENIESSYYTGITSLINLYHDNYDLFETYVDDYRKIIYKLQETHNSDYIFINRYKTKVKTR